MLAGYGLLGKTGAGLCRAAGPAGDQGQSRRCLAAGLPQAGDRQDQAEHAVGLPLAAGRWPLPPSGRSPVQPFPLSMISERSCDEHDRCRCRAVRMRNVNMRFGGVRALDDVHLDVLPGEVHALLGENGAGKSTILKILRGVQPPTSGTVEIGGTPLTTFTAEASRKAGVAMAFQEMSLMPTLTVAQNVFLNREIKTGAGLIDDTTAVAEVREALCAHGRRHRPDSQGRRHPRRPSAADRDRQGDIAALQGTGARRADHGAVAERGRAALRLRPSAAQARASRSSTSRIAWTRSSALPTAPRSCATASTSSPRRCRTSRWRSMIAHIIGRRSRGFSDVVREAGVDRRDATRSTRRCRARPSRSTST